MNTLDLQTDLQTRVEVVTLTDKGPFRKNNEDSIVVVHASGYASLGKGTLMVVADGMGGMHDGAVASSMVTAKLPALYFESRILNPVESLVQAVAELNRKVYEAGGANGMGSTVAACVIVNESLVVVNVGDSRVYLLHDGKLRQLSRDHSMRRDFFSPFRSPDAMGLSHVLTQAIGPQPSVHPHVNITRITPSAIVLLCSDGVTSSLSDSEIKEVLLASSFKNIPSELFSLVCEKQGDDNVSIIAARLDRGAPLR
jgi:protein phosphatase